MSSGALVPRAAAAGAIASPALLALARQALREAETLPDLARLVDQAEIVRLAARKATLTKEAQDDWGEYALDAKRKAGVVLAAMQAAGERASAETGRPVKACHDDMLISPVPTLVQLGVAEAPVKAQLRASRWQRLARIPEAEYAQFVATTRADPDGVLTEAAALRLAKQRERESTRRQAAVEQAALASRPALLWQEAWETWLPRQEPCDLLLTDPPYMTETGVEAIEAFARAWLLTALPLVKPTGRAYVCIGAYPAELRAYLTVPPPDHLVLAQVLVWTYRNTLGPAPALDYKANWQAILAYRGVEAGPLHCTELQEQWSVQDLNAPDGRLGNRWHTWQKPEALGERLIRHATDEGDLVLDCFAGTGTFLLAAARLGRRGRGCDHAPAMVAIAEERGCRRAT